MWRRRRNFTRRNFKHYRGMPSRLKGFYRKGGYYGRYNNTGKKKMLNEVKFFDGEFVAGSILTSSSQISASFVTIAEGTSENTRIGRKIIVTKLQIKGRALTAATATNNTSNILRLVVVLDKQCNGAAATWNDIFTTLAASNRTDAFRNMANTARFKILYDKKHTLNATTSGNGTTTLATQFQKSIDIYIPLDIIIIYNDSFTDGRISTIRSNNILMLGVIEDTNPAITYDMQFRVRFHE